MSETLTKERHPSRGVADRNQPRPEDLPNYFDSITPLPEAYNGTDVEEDIAEWEDELDTVAEQPDAEVRFTDADILGDHYVVQQLFHELSNQRMQAVEAVQAKLGNMRDTPGKYRLGLKRNIAESRYNRHKKKFDEIENLPDGILKKGRMMRHAKKFAKVEAKFNKADKAYTDRKTRMNKRTSDVGEHSVQRRDKYILDLKNRREAALARRSLRRELRKDGGGRLESRRIVKDIPKEHLDRVGKLAGLAVVSKKFEKRATKVERKSTHKEARVLEDIKANGERAKVYAGEAREADATVTKITEESLPKAEEHLTGLRDQLEQLTDDDPDRTSLIAQIEEAKRTVAIFKDREIPYWKHVAAEGKRNIVRLAEEQNKLQGKLAERRTVSAPDSEDAAKARLEAVQFANERDTAIRDITLDNEETKK